MKNWLNETTITTSKHSHESYPAKPALKFTLCRHLQFSNLEYSDILMVQS